MKSNKGKSDEDKDGMKRVGREAKERMSSQMENRKKRKNIRCACFALLALGIVSVAFWGYRFAPYDPLETNFTQKLMPPSMAHPFGTDNVGRDVLSRVLCGAGNSFKLVFLMLAIVVVIGICGRDYFGIFWRNSGYGSDANDGHFACISGYNFCDCDCRDDRTGTASHSCGVGICVVDEIRTDGKRNDGGDPKSGLCDTGAVRGCENAGDFAPVCSAEYSSAGDCHDSSRCRRNDALTCGTFVSGTGISATGAGVGIYAL